MKYKITLGNKTYEIEVEKGEATLLSEYAAATAVAAPVAPAAAPVAAPAAPAATPVAAGSGKAFPSPLPGAVLSVKAQVGQTVKKGEVILVIEAMKMENEIASPSDGKVVAILATKGQQVSVGTPLFEIA